jgi:hypothetical protein
MRLPVRLPTNNYRIIGEVGQPRVPDKLTELKTFFELNKLHQNDPHDEFKLFYTDVSRYYVWQARKREWTKRMKLETDSALCYRLNRMDQIGIKEGERFYVIILLQHVSNPVSFEDLKTVEGIVQPTFQRACVARSLLSNDTVWIQTMQEATRAQHPKMVRAHISIRQSVRSTKIVARF